MDPATLPSRLPAVGELVRIRSRHWLVEEVRPSPRTGHAAVVALACADDDAQGQSLEVYWEHEPDRQILADEGWGDLGGRGFDPAPTFAAFLNTLRWGCVTATDPHLFQSPFRAGIHLDAYQMEPLRKALQLPRVNLFIADDTGLGKTIEAGLIARELLLRRKIRTIVVAAPPSVLEQWRTELEERFGLLFEIFDRAYVTRMRRERGFGVNPWHTHSRFLVSHRLLIDPAYADPLRAWLDEVRGGTLLILDEAHHAAPSSGGRYGIESQFTRVVRHLAWKFDHRLFLSATPHNGHSNSFSTLLEILDPCRFTRGVHLRPKALEEIMVRRLKEDLRAVQGGFPRREIVRHEVRLPPDAPELVLSRLLDAYREARERRLAAAAARTRAAAGLLVVGLQQRLLSSIEAFARTLKVHRRTVERMAAAAPGPWRAARDYDVPFVLPPDADDDRADWSPEEEAAEEEAAFEEATALDAREARRDGGAIPDEEARLLEQMHEVAEAARGRPDGKALRLLDWIREHLCPGLPPYGTRTKGPPAAWEARRVIVFTENRDGTKRWLREVLERAIEGTERAEERIEVIDGQTSGPRRQSIQRRFNADPAQDPLRILLATDAAREGLNFQAHCTDLFHFDLPWNPGRIEQRNGRIDRRLQPAEVVRCHYFVLPDRAEDRVLEVLVRKTQTIQQELGSLAKVIEVDIEKRLRGGIRHREADRLAADLEALAPEAETYATVAAELEAARERRDALVAQIDRCRNLLASSREFARFDPERFRDALSCALTWLGAPGLEERRDPRGRRVYAFPRLDGRVRADPSWDATLDSLRAPRKPDQPLAAWRKEAPVRPVVFEDAGVLTDEVVHLHLEQRVAQRLLSRFRAQGFVHHDLSRACLAQTADAIPRIVLLGRLSLYGRGAERLHEEVVTVSARWTDPRARRGALAPYAKEAESKTLDLLERSLAAPTDQAVPEPVRRQLLACAPRDVHELSPSLKARAEDLARTARERLTQRGRKEADDLTATLTEQRERVRARLAEFERGKVRQLSLFGDEELRQLEDDARAWRERLAKFDEDLREEPARIRAFYEVTAVRVEPVGLVYLWPESN